MSNNVSWNQCTAFAAAASNVLERTKGKETKLTYAINRVLKRLQKAQDAVNEALGDIEIENCVTEKRGEDDVIVRDVQGNLQFTKAGIRARNAARRKYLSDANVEIDPYFATKLPDDLTVNEIEALAGFVIRPEEVAGLVADFESTIDEAVVEPAPSNAA